MPITKKISVCIITPSLQCGGAERYVAAICNAIDKSVFSITLLVVQNDSPFFVIDNNVKVIDLKQRRLLTAAIPLLKFIRLNQPDIIYSTANHVNLLLAIVKPFLPKSSFLIAWETSIVSVNHKFSKHPFLYNLFLKWFYKKIPLLVCQSNYMQQDLIKNYGFSQQQTNVIYTGIKPFEFSVECSLKEKPVFLTVSRLSAEKQIDKIITALSKLNLDFNYYIIGSGEELNSLQQLVNHLKFNNKIFFVGQLEKPFEYLDKVDLFLMASKYEGLPTTLLEATALSIPIVAYNAPGGIGEIIVDEVNGFLVNDFDQYAQTITKAIQFNFNKKHIKENTLTKFNFDQSINKLSAIFITVATSKIK